MAQLPSLASAVASLLPSMVAFRHDVHAHPEPGFEEVRTLARVQETLAAAGIRGGTVMATTGYVVDIAGTGPASSSAGADAGADAGAASSKKPACIALRADMDALRMTEGPNGLPYRSTNNGAAHMCGHDGHMAALLGAATLIANARDRLPTGTSVRLLFQPAEEGPGGAPPMIEAGCLNGVDEVRDAAGPTRAQHGPSRPPLKRPLVWAARRAGVRPPQLADGAGGRRGGGARADDGPRHRVYDHHRRPRRPRVAAARDSGPRRHRRPCACPPPTTTTFLEP